MIKCLYPTIFYYSLLKIQWKKMDIKYNPKSITKRYKRKVSLDYILNLHTYSSIMKNIKNQKKYLAIDK